MKRSEWKELIKESTKEAIKEELKDILFEVLKESMVNKSTPTQTSQPINEQQSPPKMSYDDKLKAYGEAIVSAGQNPFGDAFNGDFTPSMGDPVNGELPKGEVGLDAISNLIPK